MGEANDVHVVKDFKVNIDSFCCVGNTAAQHVQLLKICAHLLRNCNVCYFYYFTPLCLLCACKGTIVVLYLFIKHRANKQWVQLNVVVCWMILPVCSYPLPNQPDKLNQMYAYHILMLHVYPINVCVCVYMCFSLLVVPMLPCFFMLQMLI